MEEMDEAIVERTFDVDGAGEPKREIILRIGKPALDSAKGGDWFCPYQLSGVGEGRVRKAYGVDSLQAFLLCLSKAKAELDRYQRQTDVRVSWLNQDGWGLP